MTQTHNPVPVANAAFIETLSAFLREEDADRFADHFENFVVTGGLHGPGAGLTHTPAPLTAYPAGFLVTETGAIPYTNAVTTWVICDPETTGNNGSYVRVPGTHYLTAISGVQPTVPANACPLMEVTTAGGAVTAVQDIRLRGPVQRLALSGVVFSGYYASLQEAIDALPDAGGTVYIEPGTYTLMSTLTIGNGSAAAMSTRNGVVLKGVGSGPTSLTLLLWGGGADPVIQVKGPTSGWAIENLSIAGGDVATYGVEVISGQHGVLTGVGIQGCQSAGVHLTTVASSAPEASCRFNRIAGLFINATGDAGIDVDALSAAYTQNNTFENLDIHITGNGVGIRLGAAISNTFVGVIISEPVAPPGSATGSVHLAYDNDVSSQYPAGNTFLNLETQGIALSQSGTPAVGLAPNLIVGLSQAHAPPDPAVDGLAVIYVTGVGDLHLLASQNTVAGTAGDVVIGQVAIGQARNLVPELDGIALLGSPTNRWQAAHIAGGVRMHVGNVTGAYTMTAVNGFVGVDATAGAITITLPDPTDIAGQLHIVKKIDASANAVTIVSTGATGIDGVASIALAAQWDAVQVMAVGTTWYIVGVGP